MSDPVSEVDSERGLHYYGGRYYDHETGRFISPDPFVQDPDDPQNLNRYSYVLNSPPNYIDPSGYDVVDIEMCLGCTGGVPTSHLLVQAAHRPEAFLQQPDGVALPSWGSLGSSAWAGFQTAIGVGTAYWGATTLGGVAAAGGCAAALPACILGAYFAPIRPGISQHFGWVFARFRPPISEHSGPPCRG